MKLQYDPTKMCNRKVMRMACILIVSIAILGGGFCYYSQTQDEYAVYRETRGDKLVGEMQEKIIDEQQLPVAFLYYPKFDMKVLDDAILAKVADAEKENKEGNVLKMDYTSNIVYEQYINIKLITQVYVDNAETGQTVTYFSYDKVHNKMLGIDDVLRGRYVKAFSSMANNDNYTKDTMGMFQIGEDSLSIFVDGVENVFAYEDVKEYLQLDNEAIPKNGPRNINTAPKHEIDPSKPMVAFTFDDGPRRASTTRILDAFDAVGGRATFFMLGSRVAQDPEMVREVCQRGFEAANHSYSHQTLASDDTAFIEKEIFDTQDIIFNACGIESQYLRPPYGAINDNLENASDLPLILWNVDTQDWKHKNVENIKSHIRDTIEDGSIILLHDIYDSSAAVMEDILSELQEKGYQFVSISELEEYRPDLFT